MIALTAAITVVAVGCGGGSKGMSLAEWYQRYGSSLLNELTATAKTYKDANSGQLRSDCEGFLKNFRQAARAPAMPEIEAKWTADVRKARTDALTCVADLGGKPALPRGYGDVVTVVQDLQGVVADLHVAQAGSSPSTSATHSSSR